MSPMSAREITHPSIPSMYHLLDSVTDIIFILYMLILSLSFYIYVYNYNEHYSPDSHDSPFGIASL